MSTTRAAPQAAPPRIAERAAPRAALDAARSVVREPGRPVAPGARMDLERRFARDFTRVRVHDGARAGSSAAALGADAYTLGRHVVFAPGLYRPESEAGRRLLAHELAHVVQQRFAVQARPLRVAGAAGPAEREAAAIARASSAAGRALRSVAPGVIQRQPTTAPAPATGTPATGTPTVRPAGPAEATEFLDDMVAWLRGLRSFAQPAARGTLPLTDVQRRKIRGAFNQTILLSYLEGARRVLDVQLTTLGTDSPAVTPVRRAFLRVVEEIFAAAPEALVISDAMDAATRDADRATHAELMVRLVETLPMTSAGLAGATTFRPTEEVAAGTAQQAFLERYLDALIASLPGASMTAAARDALLTRINDALRRAFVTVAAGPAGTVDVRRISNPAIVAKYQRVSAMLVAGLSTPPPAFSIITTNLAPYVLPPDPVPDVSAQITSLGFTADLSQVPASELPYVRFGVRVAVSVTFPATSTIALRNAVWPLVLQVRRGGTVVGVRYDLIFGVGTVRAERIGDNVARQIDPAFTALSVPDKKAALIRQFGLSAVDDRPASGTRPAATWTSSELDQVKGAFDLIPARDVTALAGVALVRDHQGPGAATGTLAGFAHTAASAAHDTPGPPPTAPPHIHYYDFAFTANAVTAVGPPGASGPGADWTLLHEVGHFRIFRATIAANAATRAANAALTAALAAPALTMHLPQPQVPVRNAWVTARNTAHQRILAVGTAVNAPGAVTAATLTPLVTAANTARTARDTARAAMATAGLPAALVTAAAALDAASDQLLAAALLSATAEDQVPIFSALATRFGFTAFTDYARREGAEEFFAETYALYLTDPDRLNRMNRSIFLWFEAGLPMNRTWSPPAP